ncbi:putative transcriptional regulator [Macrophomina phaseolina]|uniref:Transcriptional regulator n=1 Tax=Macrophomina phaseolina TaxID=35725 RepID=A0ABQ8GTK1_9PEZI|nr:putative transcriptional regulator [Macrophomina phaseolina]
MSDSDADPTPTLPPDAEIEQTLRGLVRDIWLSGNHDNLTVNHIRNSAEAKLHLPEAFFKTDPAWKPRSKAIVTDQFDGSEAEAAEPEEPPKKKSAPNPRSVPQKRKAQAKKPAGASTKSSERKRQKVSGASDEDEDSAKSRVIHEDSEGEDTSSPTLLSASSRKGSLQPGLADDDGDVTNAHKKSKSPDQDTKPEASDSDMSVLIDEPPKKKRQRNAGPAKEKNSKPASKKGNSKEVKEPDPQEAEIRRLQGWLVKCGIRKLWGKELKPFDTPKAKINHLKEMLKEAGMDGRYSVEKARQIKERRELAADLEAVQEGAKRWGQSEEEEVEDAGTRPRRRLAKGLKDLEGLIESEGEESD